MKKGESSKHRKRRNKEEWKGRKERRGKVKAMRKRGYEDNGEKIEAEQERNELHWGWH